MCRNPIRSEPDLFQLLAQAASQCQNDKVRTLLTELVEKGGSSLWEDLGVGMSSAAKFGIYETFGLILDTAKGILSLEELSRALKISLAGASGSGPIDMIKLILSEIGKTGREDLASAVAGALFSALDAARFDVFQFLLTTDGAKDISESRFKEMADVAEHLDRREILQLIADRNIEQESDELWERMAAST